MKKLFSLSWKCGLATVGLLAIPGLAMAGGAFSTTKAGQQVLWSGPATYRIETGALKGANTGGGGGGGGGGSSGGCLMTKALDISNADGAQIVRDAFNTWKGVPNSSIDIQEGPSLGVDVNFDNLENFWVGSFFPDLPPAQQVQSTVTAAGCYDSDPNTPCLNSVIFDNDPVPDRSVTDAIQGRCARFNILAFAAILPQQNNDGSIANAALKSAQLVVSAACVDPVDAADPSCVGNPSGFDSQCPPGGISLTELKGTVTHEVGHFLGMDHTLINKQNYIDCETGKPTCNLENVPTMTGLFVPGADLTTLHYDDMVTFAKHYPAAGTTTQSPTDGFGVIANVPIIPGTCTIAGRAFRSDKTTQQRCLEVVAKLNNDPATSAGMISGAEVGRNSVLTSLSSGADANGANGDCSDAANCSNFVIPGLNPGTYTLAVHNFNDNGAGSGLDQFNIEPCHPALSGGGGILDNESPAVFRLNGVLLGANQATVSCTAGAITMVDVRSN